MAKHHTFWFVTCLLIFQITALAEDTSAPVNARQVMLKFVESQKKLKSYIIKTNSTTTFSYTGFYNGNQPGTMYHHYDDRFDGDRVKESLTFWGDIKNDEMDVSKENALYRSCLWDGETGYELSLIGKNRLQTSKYPGTVKIHEKGGTFGDYMKESYMRTMISPAQGYVKGNDQDIGTLLLRADAKVKLLDKRSKVNGVDCYVVEAEVPQRGKYRAWIDPVHDFNLACLRSRRETGDISLGGKLLGKDVKINYFYEVLEFQEVNGVWLPKTFKTKDKTHDGGYDFDHQQERITELYEVNLAPDHDKEGSFLTDDIPNGTQVRLEGVSLSVILIWQDGKVVDRQGMLIMDCLQPKEGPKSKDPNDTSKDKEFTAELLLNKYAMTLDKFKSYIIKSNNHATVKTRVSGAQEWWPKIMNGEYERDYYQELRYDGDKFKFCRSEWGDINRDMMNVSKTESVYHILLWNGNQFIQYDTKEIDQPGRLFLHRNKPADWKYDKSLMGSYQAAALPGYFTDDAVCIAEIVKQAKTIKLRAQKETINGYSCCVIEIDSQYGQWKIWIGPEHSYNLVKVELRQKEGDLWIRDFRVGEGERKIFVLENIEHRQIVGQWVPIKTRIQRRTLFSDGGFSQSDLIINIEEIIINPNHDDLGSFSPSGIKNDSHVRIVGEKGKYIWQDGKVVDKAGKVVDLRAGQADDPNQAEDGEKADESLAGKDPNQVGTVQAQSDDADKRLKKTTRTEDTLSVRELLERYAATQTKAFTSFIHKSETREDMDMHCTEQHGGIPPRTINYTKFYEHDFCTDGLRIQRK